MEFAQELQFYTFAMRGGTNILIGERIPVLPNGCFSIVRSVLKLASTAIPPVGIAPGTLILSDIDA